MTCKDCVHYKPCFYANIDNCEYFKDKSKFIELPCKVGDKVYEVVKQGNSGEIIERTVRSIEISKRSYFVNMYRTSQREDSWVQGSELGKTVFLTYEAAEAALKEREQNE